MPGHRLYTLFTVALLLCPAMAVAADTPADDGTKTFVVTMKHRWFEPLELVVPKDHKLKIIVVNKDRQPIEFDSIQLHRNQVIQPDGEGVISFEPLLPGTYEYENTFHRASKGYITVK